MAPAMIQTPLPAFLAVLCMAVMAVQVGAGGDGDSGPRVKARVLALVPVPFAGAALRQTIRDTWMAVSKATTAVTVETLFVVGGHITKMPPGGAIDPSPKFWAGCHGHAWRPDTDEAKWKVNVFATSYRSCMFDLGVIQELCKPHSTFGVWDEAFQAEVRAHNDILFLPMRDAAKIMAPKSLAMFEWAYHNRPDVDYIVKIDSDTYPYWPRFQALFTVPAGKRVLGKKHTGWKYFGDPKIGGELYGVSRATLVQAMASIKLESHQCIHACVEGMVKDWLKGRKEEGSDWAHRPLWGRDEDVGMSLLFRRASNATWDTIKTPHHQQYWVHPIKDQHAFRTCHTTGHCVGEGRTTLTFDT